MGSRIRCISDFKHLFREKRSQFRYNLIAYRIHSCSVLIISAICFTAGLAVVNNGACGITAHIVTGIYRQFSHTATGGTSHRHGFIAVTVRAGHSNLTGAAAGYRTGHFSVASAGGTACSYVTAGTGTTGIFIGNGLFTGAGTG